jgi:hypothetical protein
MAKSNVGFLMSMTAFGGILSGLTIGTLVLGPMFMAEPEVQSNNTGTTSISSAITQADLDELERLKADAKRAADRYEAAESAHQAARAERDQIASAEAAAQSQIHDLRASKQELAEKLSEREELLSRAIETLDRAGLQPISNEEIAAQEAARVAEARGKGQVIVSRLEQMLANDPKKDEVLAALRELANIGLDAAPEYFKAFEMISALGGPYNGAEKNELGLNFVEYTQILPPVFAEFALTDKSGVAPVGAQIFAMYSLPWNATRSVGEKAELLGGILATNNPSTIGPAVDNLAILNSREAIPHLARAAANGGIDSDARARAIIGMAQQGDNADWGTIESLLNDPDPKVSQAARVSTTIRNPPVDGYLITTVYPGNSASAGGMQVGDIILRYNGQPVKDQASLLSARDSSGESAQVQVNVLRGGSEVTLTMRAGQMGVEGRAITKR